MLVGCVRAVGRAKHDPACMQFKGHMTGQKGLTCHESIGHHKIGLLYALLSEVLLHFMRCEEVVAATESQ
jgi:hypothetical protein